MSNSLVAAKPTHAIEDDQLHGVILISVTGFFDLPTLRDHFAENGAVVKQWRAAGRPMQVLIDAVDLKPHSLEGQACVQEATALMVLSV
ncbi:hypothetical protein [Sphingomonas sp. Leaf37]|uniref:hypothetical protein n=1 Tax=Sphingomonas sp. Leaf37 TaxID=2876552 RepID=UPI001E314145|nr:hypothetical protein [Sphingomonas sp. Leaf37]